MLNQYSTIGYVFIPANSPKSDPIPIPIPKPKIIDKYD